MAHCLTVLSTEAVKLESEVKSSMQPYTHTCIALGYWRFQLDYIVIPRNVVIRQKADSLHASAVVLKVMVAGSVHSISVSQHKC